MPNRLTAFFSEIEADEQRDHTAHDKQKAEEVELRHMFPQCLGLNGVEIQGEEQHKGGQASRRPVSAISFSIDPRDVPHREAYKFIQKHLPEMYERRGDVG